MTADIERSILVAPVGGERDLVIRQRLVLFNTAGGRVIVVVVVVSVIAVVVRDTTDAVAVSSVIVFVQTVAPFLIANITYGSYTEKNTRSST